MDVLVTGGLGYVGSALVQLLCEDARVDRVVVLDSLTSGSPRALSGTLSPADATGEDPDGATVDFRRGDVREYGDVESAMRGVDSVIHLAAITDAASTHDRREETFAVNLDGTENVLTAAGKLGVETVAFASSCNVYGRATSTDIDESTDPDPINPYAEAKAAAESLVAEACEEHGIHGTSLRLSTNYRIAEIADLVSEIVGPVDVTYLEDEHPGPSYHVNFDRLAETGFEPEWGLEDGIVHLAQRFTEGSRG